MCGLARGLVDHRPAEPRGRGAGAGQSAALCRAGAGDRRRSSGGAGDRRGARRQRRPGLCRRGRARMPTCRSRSSTAPRRRGCRPPGVLAGIPEADGIVGDLGGGSVELVRVGPAARPRAAARIGRGITLPLGPLRLAELGDNAEGRVGSGRAGARRGAGRARRSRCRPCTWSAARRGRSPGCTWSTRAIRSISSTSTRSLAARPKRSSRSSAGCRANRWSGSPRSRASASKWCRWRR